jgi:Flp pilus assembly protein CpaB
MRGRPFTIIGAIVAVVALGLFLLLGQRGGGGLPTNVALKPEVVAARDISNRVPLTAADVKVVNVAASAIPPQSFTDAAQVRDLIPVVNIFKGQAITANLLVSSSDQISATQAAFLPIPQGYVARTIPTSEQQGVAGFIQAGDYITIAAIVGPPGAIFRNARTVFTNVHVLRTGVANASTAPVESGKPAPSPSAQGPGVSSSLTIIVTQCQAEFIDWFLTNGSITYTLESYHDYAPKDAKVDSSCPSVDAATGVSLAVVNRAWPGLAQ